MQTQIPAVGKRRQPLTPVGAPAPMTQAVQQPASAVPTSAPMLNQTAQGQGPTPLTGEEQTPQTLPPKPPPAPTAPAPVSAVPHAPPPPSPVTTPPPPPPAPLPPGTQTAPLAGTQTLRNQAILPAQTDRATAMAGRTDQAADAVQGFDRIASVGSYADDYNARLGVSPVGFTGVETDVSRRQVDPNVSRAAIDPNVQFNAVQTDINAGAQIGPEDSADLTKFRDYRGTAADTLASGKTRSEIAQAQMEAFDLENQPALRDQLRAVGQRAASLGRLGMGDTAVEALNPFTDYLSRRAALGKQLGAETAEGEITDRRANLEQFSGLVDDEEAFGKGRRDELRGERSFAADVESANIARRVGERDTALGVSERNIARQAQEADAQSGLAERNRERDLALSAEDAALAERNLARRADERDTSLGLDERNAGRDFDARRAALEGAMSSANADQAGGLSSLGLLGDLESQNAAREAAQRGEVRGERDFQTTLDRMALEDALRQQQLEWGREGELWNRSMAESALAQGYNPAGVYLGAAGQYGAYGANSLGNAGDLLAAYMARQKQGG